MHDMTCPTTEPPPILEAWWLDPNTGIACLSRDWLETAKPPPLRLNPGNKRLRKITRAPLKQHGRLAGYYQSGDTLTFYLWSPRFPNLEWKEKAVYVAGDFNAWADAIGQAEWKMHRHAEDGGICFHLTVPAATVLDDKPIRFKFVTAEGQWQTVPADAPNREENGEGTHNFILHPQRTGHNLFLFHPQHEHSILGHEELLWDQPDGRQSCPIRLGDFLTRLGSDHHLGALVDDSGSRFRLFAPRARSVTLALYHQPDGSDPQRIEMQQIDHGVWETHVAENLHGRYYHYFVDGDDDGPFAHFDPKFPILDPYALAAVNRNGPGIVIARDRLPRAHHHQPPHWHDLVIMETHVRDLIARAGCLADNERMGFSGLAKWLRSDDCYLKQTGINAVELQPIQEFDNAKAEDYHWGYMTCNWFAPASAYASDSAQATQIGEFKDVVDAFHEAGMAVILDVVYNHVGEPNHLLYIDKQYYFETDHSGNLMNWSGCGNDFRAHAAMARRLIIDSLIHLIETYGVDGFRFDLAELLGVDVLHEIEHALKKIKPSVILIAEPWSFRGHIAQALRHTGWSSWNDGYREFALRYVTGNGSQEDLHYFLSGSPHYFAIFPAQTVNYSESHDDRTWIDRLTENAAHNGGHPTANDRRRTHLMAALLMCSLGIPMLAEGQDFLRSKHGENNSYLRGDLNALDYERLRVYAATHAYFRAWIRFRLSENGKALRLHQRPPKGYMRFFHPKGSSAGAVLINADRSAGPRPILFAINPHTEAVEFDMADLAVDAFRPIADHERFDPHGLAPPHFRWNAHALHLPALTCGLWLGAGPGS